MENNSRKSRDLVGKLAQRQPKKGSTYSSQGKKKKEDEVADDEDEDDEDDDEDDDDDAVRTSVSQNRVTATLRTEELFPSTQYIFLSPHIRWLTTWMGEDSEGQHATMCRAQLVSLLPARPHHGLQSFQ